MYTPTYTLQLQCASCGSALPDRHPTGGTRPKFCSVDCLGVAMRQRAPWNKGLKHRPRCLHCGKRCKRSGRLFCSRDCQSQAGGRWYDRSNAPPERRRKFLPKPPTPEEIAERCAEVRAGWTDAEREARAVACPQSWTPPRRAMPPGVLPPRNDFAVLTDLTAEGACHE